MPFTPEILLKIHSTLDFAFAEDLVFWSVITTGFFSLARAANLLHTSSDSFQIKRGQIFIDGNVMLLVFSHTKTIQFGEKQLLIPLLAIKNSPLCPITAYRAMLERIPAPADAPAFVLPCLGNLVPYTYSKFSKKLRDVISLIDMNPRLYTSHSMRRGGASLAYHAGVPMRMIQIQGDWASDSYLRYIKLPHSDRLAVAQKLAGAVM